MPRNDDDEDDRPRKRRRPRDDEDDDRPRARRSRDDEDDDRPRPRSRTRDRDSEEDDYDDRPRRRRKKPQPQVPVVGIVALAFGVLALILSFSACFTWLAIIPGLIGIGAGVVGFITAQNSRGRQAPYLPIGGAVLSLIACVIAVVSMVSFARDVKKFEKEIQAEMAKAEKEEAARQKELAKAPAEVQGANPQNVHFLTADQFYKFWEDALEADNEERFDRAYKNKIIELTGVIEDINLVGDNYTVYLKAGGDGDQVACAFPKEPAVRARLVQLMPGAQIRIRGKCLGGDPSLEACILVQ
jgi:hypothetical protein